MSSRVCPHQRVDTLTWMMICRGAPIVHTIGNGRIMADDHEDARSGKHVASEAVGKTHLWLAQQESTLWTYKVDSRPGSGEMSGCIPICQTQVGRQLYTRIVVQRTLALGRTRLSSPE